MRINKRYFYLHNQKTLLARLLTTLHAIIRYYAMILSAMNYVNITIMSLVAVNMILVRCPWFTSMRKIHSLEGSILIITFTTQYYGKAQPKLNAFDEQYLELEADLGRQNRNRQSLLISSYLAILYFKFFFGL